jgi:hypothetical protein
MDPFEGMTTSPDGKYRRISCSGDECRSGEIKGNLTGNYIRFKYDQQIGSDRADGWIIIDK